MIIHSTDERLFETYGRVIRGFDTSKLCLDLKENTPLPKEGTIYVPSDENLEKNELFSKLQDNIYGGMPIQFGYCNGFNTKLNCLEFHKDSELNLSNQDFILLLARKWDMIDYCLDTSNVVAFKVRAGELVEIYSTTLHYAPCQSKKDKGFKVLVVLPKGTNTEKPNVEVKDKEDEYLFARNKWLFAHKEANEVNKGALISLVGKNIDLSKDI